MCKGNWVGQVQQRLYLQGALVVLTLGGALNAHFQVQVQKESVRLHSHFPAA